MRILVLFHLLATALAVPILPTIPARFVQLISLLAKDKISMSFPVRGLESEGYKTPPIFSIPLWSLQLRAPVVVANTSGTMEPIGTRNGTSTGLLIIPSSEIVIMCPASSDPGWYEFYQSCPILEWTVRAWLLDTERRGYRLALSQVDFTNMSRVITKNFSNCRNHGKNGNTPWDGIAGCKGIVPPEPNNKDWDLDPNGREDEEIVWKRLVDLLEMGDKWPGMNYGPEFPYDKWGNKKTSKTDPEDGNEDENSDKDN